MHVRVHYTMYSLYSTSERLTYSMIFRPQINYPHTCTMYKTCINSIHVALGRLCFVTIISTTVLIGK